MPCCKKGRPLKTEIYENIKSTDDIELMRKRLEKSSEYEAQAQNAETYDPEPEIEDIELLDDRGDPEQASLDEQEIESLLRLLDDGR